MLALIDGDIIVYTAGFSAEKRNKETGEKVIFPEEFAIANTKRVITAILDAVDTTNYKLYLTSSEVPNYRDSIATIKVYKGNRKDVAKPVHYKAIREYLITRWKAKLITGQEADDALGIAQYAAWEMGSDDTIICSCDKDLLMIPGLHYNIRKGTIQYIDEDDAILNFYCQLITGDSTDNIPGLRGYGDKYPFIKARKYLAGCSTEQELYAKVHALYTEKIPKGTVNTRLEEVGRLLWIRRKEKEVWVPPLQFHED